MRRQIALSEGWTIHELGEEAAHPAAVLRCAGAREGQWFAATMPAQVHEILLAHGRISDPRWGKNAADSAWVAERDWLYAASFASPAPGRGPVWLRFLGLDTLVTAYLNGREIGRWDNMFRQWAAEVRELLAPAGEQNQLVLHFRSPMRAIAAHEQPPEHVEIVATHKYLRKCLTDFGSYLGSRPHAVKTGIYDEVLLDVAEQGWLEDVWVRCQLAPDHQQARLEVQVKTGGAGGEGVRWTLADAEGNPVAQGRASGRGGAIAIELPQPQLWWPHTHGTPYLYTLAVRLEGGGEVLDERTVRVGIREVQAELTDPQTGEARFRFRVNGAPIFLQGAGMAPFEGISHCPRPQRMKRLLELSVGAQMNLLRVWGDGNLPEAAFYDECDQRGILVWHDFMFGFGMYPDDDPALLENVRAEATELVRRVRNHPCLLLWVGGNENHMGYDFARGGYSPVGRRIFEQLLPEVCAAEDPGRLYHPSSPFGVVPTREDEAPNWPLAGDWHDYTTVTFSPQASVPLFASEIGRVSTPSLNVMRRFMSAEELWPAGFDPAIRKPGQPAWPPMWGYRAAGGAWEKIGAIEEYPDAADARGLIRALGTAHGEYLQRRVERERRGVPDGCAPEGASRGVNRRCWGNMVWRLNDAWPTIYWAVIDYELEPKIAYYFLRRAHALTQLSFARSADEIAVWVVNDALAPLRGTLQVSRMRFDGTVRGTLSAEVAVEAGQAVRALDLTPFGPISLRHEFLLAQLGPLQATHLLIAERYLALPPAQLRATLTPEGVALATDLFARQVSLEMDYAIGAVFEDNYFDLVPGQQRTVRILERAGGRSLTVRGVNAEPLTLVVP
jgi:hypothetical protein